MRAATTSAPDGDDVPVVGFFAVAAQLRMTTTGTTARVSVTLPEVDVTGFTLGVTNDLTAIRSAIAVDSDLLLGTDGGVLLIAATLLAGAEHLLDAADHPTDPHAPTRARSQHHRNPRRSR